MKMMAKGNGNVWKGKTKGDGEGIVENTAVAVVVARMMAAVLILVVAPFVVPVMVNI